MSSWIKDQDIIDREACRDIVIYSIVLTAALLFIGWIIPIIG